MIIVKFILKYIFFIYFSTVISVSVHELAHYVTAKAFNFQNVFLCIGFLGVCGIKTNSFFISPLAFTGFVEFIEPKDQCIPKYKLFIFYFAGISINILFLLIALLFRFEIVVLINLIIITVSMLPFSFSKSDLYCYWKHVHSRRKNTCL